MYTGVIHYRLHTVHLTDIKLMPIWIFFTVDSEIDITGNRFSPTEAQLL